MGIPEHCTVGDKLSGSVGMQRRHRNSNASGTWSESLLVQQRKPSVIVAEVQALSQACLFISCEHVIVNQDLHYSWRLSIALQTMYVNRFRYTSDNSPA